MGLLDVPPLTPVSVRARIVPEGYFRWLTRARRILLMMAMIWVVSVFDLGYTLLESLHRGFVEMNPIAAAIIHTSPAGLVIYKTVLVTISSGILLAFRHHRIAELASYLLVVTYGLLALRWVYYYDQRLAALCDPASNIDPLIGMIR